MLSTELRYLCTGLKCILDGWNASPRVGMLPRAFECFRQSWNNFVQSSNSFYRGGMPSTGLEFFLEC
jgi:hypothetical protein